jgi:hypothetical protein
MTISSHDRYAHLRANAASQRQTTIERLSQAIAQLETEGRPVNTFTIKEVSGLDYMAYYRNPEALALFRAHSTHLRKEREKTLANHRRSKLKGTKQDDTLHQIPVQPRDPLLAYKKPELVAKLRATRDECEQIKSQAQTERAELEQRYKTLLQEHMLCGLKIAKLEAQQVEFHAFMDRFRSSLRREEHEPHP